MTVRPVRSGAFAPFSASCRFYALSQVYRVSERRAVAPGGQFGGMNGSAGSRDPLGSARAASDKPLMLETPALADSRRYPARAGVQESARATPGCVAAPLVTLVLAPNDAELALEPAPAAFQSARPEHGRRLLASLRVSIPAAAVRAAAQGSTNCRPRAPGFLLWRKREQSSTTPSPGRRPHSSWSARRQMPESHHPAGGADGAPGAAGARERRPKFCHRLQTPPHQPHDGG